MFAFQTHIATLKAHIGLKINMILCNLCCQKVKLTADLHLLKKLFSLLTTILLWVLSDFAAHQNLK